MKPPYKQSTAGYTLIELIVIMVIVAVLASIAAPGWLGFLNRQRLNVAQSEAVSALREAQANAKRQRRTWVACFQDNGTVVRWAVSPRVNDTWNCSLAGNWQNLTGSDANKIAIDTAKSFSAPTFSAAGSASAGYYSVEFNDKGWAARSWSDNSKDLGKITFSIRNEGGTSRRCVFVATLLGSVRTDSNSNCNN
ncbi:MAG TPA: prepilin-type cleavage/methylation domain-containing protein [Cyanobacteria bacterium UBA11372]|nr:prepilin-type cleavage/methylation domain-containing protein [Cyanobacteria bacterium UBA11372]